MPIENGKRGNMSLYSRPGRVTTEERIMRGCRKWPACRHVSGRLFVIENCPADIQTGQVVYKGNCRIFNLWRYRLFQSCCPVSAVYALLSRGRWQWISIYSTVKVIKGHVLLYANKFVWIYSVKVQRQEDENGTWNYLPLKMKYLKADGKSVPLCPMMVDRMVKIMFQEQSKPPDFIMQGQALLSAGLYAISGYEASTLPFAWYLSWKSLMELSW